jgi:anaerobic ribonucleoside-triphosphate reductase activating protein
VTTIRLSRLHHPVTTLGHGLRAGVWVQGCSIGCAGCVSRDTWVAGPEHEVRVEDVLAWLADRLPVVDGVTISGGEPFEQPVALGRLLEGLRAQLGDRAADVLCYSGYTYPVLRRRYPQLLALLDAVVAGPFVRARAAALPLRGSDNQTVVPLSTLGRARYGGQLRPVRRLQVSAEPGALWYVGIPAPGDLQQLDAMLRERGVEQGAVSWLA